MEREETTVVTSARVAASLHTGKPSEVAGVQRHSATPLLRGGFSRLCLRIDTALPPPPPSAMDAQPPRPRLRARVYSGSSSAVGPVAGLLLDRGCSMEMEKDAVVADARVVTSLPAAKPLVVLGAKHHPAPSLLYHRLPASASTPAATLPPPLSSAPWLPRLRGRGCTLGCTLAPPPSLAPLLDRGCSPESSPQLRAWRRAAATRRAGRAAVARCTPCHRPPSHVLVPNLTNTGGSMRVRPSTGECRAYFPIDSFTLISLLLAKLSSLLMFYATMDVQRCTIRLGERLPDLLYDLCSSEGCRASRVVPL